MCHTDIGCFNSFNWGDQGRALVFILLHCLSAVQSLLSWTTQTKGIIKGNVLCSSMPNNVPNISLQPWSWEVNLWKHQEKRISSSNLIIQGWYQSRDGEMLYSIGFINCGLLYSLLMCAHHKSSVYSLTCFTKSKESLWTCWCSGNSFNKLPFLKNKINKPKKQNVLS